MSGHRPTALQSKKTPSTRKRAGAARKAPGKPVCVSPQAIDERSVPTAPPQGDIFDAPFARVDTAWVKNELTAFTEDEIHHLVAPKRTFARRQSNQQPLTVEETDKALRLARIAKLAQSVFGDAEKAGRWMRKPKQSLAGAAPLAYLASENGARLVEDMLYRIDAGFAF